MSYVTKFTLSQTDFLNMTVRSLYSNVLWQSPDPNSTFGMCWNERFSSGYICQQIWSENVKMDQNNNNNNLQNRYFCFQQLVHQWILFCLFAWKVCMLPFFFNSPTVLFFFLTCFSQKQTRDWIENVVIMLKYIVPILCWSILRRPSIH